MTRYGACRSGLATIRCSAAGLRTSITWRPSRSQAPLWRGAICHVSLVAQYAGYIWIRTHGRTLRRQDAPKGVKPWECGRPWLQSLRFLISGPYWEQLSNVIEISCFDLADLGSFVLSESQLISHIRARP